MPERLAQDLLVAKSVQLIQEAAMISDGGARDALLHRASVMANAARVADLWALSPGLPQAR